MEHYFNREAVLKETNFSGVFLYKHKENGSYIVKIFSLNPNDDVFRILKNKSHPNLPLIFDVCADDNGITVLEEYIEGDRLDTILEKGPLEKRVACRYACQLCDALTFLHSFGIIHRDIKPSNVIIKKDGTAVLIDLSIARQISENDTDTRELGTPGFAAPEQFGISQSGKETDIYALGVLLNLMLTGVHPTVNMPKGYCKRIIKKATSTQMTKRFRSAKSMKKQLAPFT